MLGKGDMARTVHPGWQLRRSPVRPLAVSALSRRIESPVGALARFTAQAVAAALLTVLAVTLALRPSPYLVVLPGSVHELGPQIHLPADQRRDTGWFAF